MVKIITDSNFNDEVLKAKIAIIDFYAPWCGPCRVFGPILEEFSNEVDSNVVVGKMNVDENQNIPNQFGITSIPSILVFKDGKLHERFVGVQSKSTLLNAIK